MGGLSRRTTAIQTNQALTPTVSVDVGGALLKSGGVNGPEADQNRLKAQAVAEAFGHSGLQVMGLSSADWQLGAETVFALVKQYELPILAANLVCEDRKPFSSHIVVEAGGKRLGFVGVTEGQISGCALHDPVRSIQEALVEMGDVDVRILLLPVSTRKLELFSEIEADVALLLGGQRTKGWTEDSAIPLSIPARGKTLGQVRLTWRPQGTSWKLDAQNQQGGVLRERLIRRLNSLERRLDAAATDEERRRLEERRVRFQTQLREIEGEMAQAKMEDPATFHQVTLNQLPLDAKVADDVTTETIVQKTLDKMNALELGSGQVKLFDRVAPASSQFLGANGCMGCHPAQNEQWMTTGHAKAMTTLIAENHQGDRDCVACHSTGYGAPSGPQNPREIQGLRDVQCEACHGPGRQHAADPKGHPLARVPNVATCVFCHDGERDGGRFDRDTYWPKIVHSQPKR